MAQLCEIFCPEGIFNVQLIENQNGELYIFEVNPRISTTACLAVHLGCDPIKNYFDNSDNTRITLPEVKLTRTWHNSVRFI